MPVVNKSVLYKETVDFMLCKRFAYLKNVGNNQFWAVVEMGFVKLVVSS